jgi:hypothetical protein
MIKLAANLQNLIKASEKNRFDTSGTVTERHLDYTPSSAGDYALYGGAGALGGAGIGALVNYLRDRPLAEGALLGAGLGGAAGLGTRGIMDTIQTREFSRSENSPGGMKDTLRVLTGGGQTGNALLDMSLSKNPALAGELRTAQERAKAFADLQQRSHEDRIARGAGGEYEQRIKDLVESLENQALANKIQAQIDKTGSHKRAASSAGDYAMYGGGGALGGAGIGALVNYLRDKSVAEGALVGGGIGGAAGLGTRGIMDLLANGAPVEEGSPTPAHGGDFQRDAKNQQLQDMLNILATTPPGPDANALHKKIVDLTLQLGDSRAKNTA